MKKTILITLLLALALVCFAKDAATQASPKYESRNYSSGRPAAQLILEKTERLMQGIYNDIIAIRNKYEELKGFAQAAYYYEGTYETDTWRKIFGYSVNAASIAFYGFPGATSPSPCPSINFYLTKDKYSHRARACAVVEPAYKVYLKDIGYSFIFEYRLDNEKLKDELIEIAEKNIRLCEQSSPAKVPADTKTIVGRLEIPYPHSLIGTIIHTQSQGRLPIHPDAITAGTDIYKYNGHIVKMLAKVKYLKPGPDSQLKEGKWITEIKSIKIIE